MRVGLKFCITEHVLWIDWMVVTIMDIIGSLKRKLCIEHLIVGVFTGTYEQRMFVSVCACWRVCTCVCLLPLHAATKY